VENRSKSRTRAIAIAVVAVVLVASLVFIGYRSYAKPGSTLTLATTTSTQDSGLLEVLIPAFEKAGGIKVKVLAQGSGQAMETGRKGDADVLLVHSRKAEDQFVVDGQGIDRKDVMYNDFVIVGPAADPAGIKGSAKAADAMAKLAAAGAAAKATFISRGDNSGTHVKEKDLWTAAGVKPAGTWYLSAGAGMADVLRMAGEKAAYTLTDRATYLNLKDKLNLPILVEGDKALYNPYGVIAVNPKAHPNVNYKGATAFIKYITGPAGRKIISEYGRDKFGSPLFFLYPETK
jgi:tungstate transport system substrate-binding protein